MRTRLSEAGFSFFKGSEVFEGNCLRGESEKFRSRHWRRPFFMSLRERILHLLANPHYQPLDKVGITKALGLSADQRGDVRRWLQSLEHEGAIARIRKNHYVMPAAADLVTGIVVVFPSGNARLVDESGRSPELRISSANLGVAMHRDRVVARVLRNVDRDFSGQDSKEGRVIRILERANMTVVGTVHETRGFFHLVPDDPRLQHDIYLRCEKGAPPERHPKAGEKVVVRMDPWESRHVSPEGEIIERLGPAGAKGVDVQALIRRFDLPERFEAEVEREALAIPEALSPSDWEGREDYRGQPVITIDPDDAKDFDDAIHVERLGGGWLLSVHIADVSHYVRRGSALDREARRRGNSTYLADRVVPMLPERLSNGLCSLKPGVERLAFSTFLEFNAQGNLKHARFARTVIRSIARLTYRQALAILEGNLENREDLPLSPPGSLPFSNPVVMELVKKAWEFASMIRRQRFAAGSLDLDFPEVKVWLDGDGRAQRLEKVENDPSHQLIEECMLAANEAVAAALKRRKTPAVYRIHEVPDPDRLKEFREKARMHGYKVGDLTQRREVQKLLSAIRGRPEEHLVKLDFLKSLKRASYDLKPLGHYGLAKANYTHFTSPIRRYADLLVHRALAGEVLGKAGELGETAIHISETERRSAEAEKESVLLKKLEFFERQLHHRKRPSFQAVVVDVRSHGLVVEITDALVTGMIHVSALPGDFYVFDEAKLSFRGRRSRRRYSMGSKLDVIVCRVDMQKRHVDFMPVEE
ncbi:MAG: ribonuclease [Verrucomicrobiota bacterium]|jgi:ribonuclease R